MSEIALYWVGVDVADRTFDAAIAGSGEHANAATIRRIPVETFDRTPDGVRRFMGWLHTRVPAQEPWPVRVVMEATGIYSIQLTALLSKACPQLRPAIANPEQTCAFRDSLGLRNKTDRLDARALAFFGVERRPAPYEPLSPQQAELRSLSRCRDDLIEMRNAHENRLHQGPASRLVHKTLNTLLARLDKAIHTIEREMKRVIESHADLQRHYTLLTSIPGVGFVTAAVVLAEFGDLRRFGCSRQIGAHAGVTASKRESGKRLLSGHMSKKGNPRVRQALYMAALSATLYNPSMRTTYRRLLAHGKKPMVAIGAIMRKLLVLMRAIIVSAKPFDPCGKPRQRDPKLCPETA
jgi:transposase